MTKLEETILHKPIFPMKRVTPRGLTHPWSQELVSEGVRAKSQESCSTDQESLKLTFKNYQVKWRECFFHLPLEKNTNYCFPFEAAAVLLICYLSIAPLFGLARTACTDRGGSIPWIRCLGIMPTTEIVQFIFKGLENSSVSWGRDLRHKAISMIKLQDAKRDNSREFNSQFQDYCIFY